MYSDVINWLTIVVFPTSDAPRICTLEVGPLDCPPEEYEVAQEVLVPLGVILEAVEATLLLLLDR